MGRWEFDDRHPNIAPCGVPAPPTITSEALLRAEMAKLVRERNQAMRDAVRLHEAMRLGKCGMVIDDSEVEELALRNAQYRDTLGIE